MDNSYNDQGFYDFKHESAENARWDRFRQEREREDMLRQHHESMRRTSQPGFNPGHTGAGVHAIPVIGMILLALIAAPVVIVGWLVIFLASLCLSVVDYLASISWGHYVDMMVHLCYQCVPYVIIILIPVITWDWCRRRIRCHARQAQASSQASNSRTYTVGQRTTQARFVVDGDGNTVDLSDDWDVGYKMQDDDVTQGDDVTTWLIITVIAMITSFVVAGIIYSNLY